ncbi:MAG TPA: hypothetical protein IGS17_04085 [Oscillatoriales cyanobacterium M59_W2019_021]|nr:MAG: hypothetical protein D6728_10085 [Cyanobacteria bacterium J055]HIK31406.1 hypothetical protein [Oscillatoriales cyanobacterium M4454_W2019_049]HIK50096.1 hypothetical protein [Oscillatoriales cyanobacterium M59_W2019_021]
MTSPLKKYILPAFVLPSAIFAASTLPLALLSTQQVAIEIQEETVFTGQLRDIATPYLAVATAVSVTVGIAGVAVTGWKQSTSKSTELEAKLEAQQTVLKKKEEQIEELKISPSVLEAAGLDSFLQDSNPKPQLALVPAISEASASEEEVPQPQPEPESPRLQVLQFPTAAATAPESSNIDEIHTRLQQLQTQLETLQKAVVTQPQPATFQLKVPDMRQILPSQKVAV